MGVLRTNGLTEVKIFIDSFKSSFLLSKSHEKQYRNAIVGTLSNTGNYLRYSRELSQKSKNRLKNEENLRTASLRRNLLDFIKRVYHYFIVLI